MDSTRDLLTAAEMSPELAAVLSVLFCKLFRLACLNAAALGLLLGILLAVLRTTSALFLSTAWPGFYYALGKG